MKHHSVPAMVVVPVFRKGGILLVVPVSVSLAMLVKHHSVPVMVAVSVFRMNGVQLAVPVSV